MSRIEDILSSSFSHFKRKCLHPLNNHSSVSRASLSDPSAGCQSEYKPRLSLCFQEAGSLSSASRAVYQEAMPATPPQFTLPPPSHASGSWPQLPVPFQCVSPKGGMGFVLGPAYKNTKTCGWANLISAPACGPFCIYTQTADSLRKF